MSSVFLSCLPLDVPKVLDERARLLVLVWCWHQWAHGSELNRLPVASYCASHYRHWTCACRFQARKSPWLFLVFSQLPPCRDADAKTRRYVALEEPLLCFLRLSATIVPTNLFCEHLLGSSHSVMNISPSQASYPIPRALNSAMGSTWLQGCWGREYIRIGI